MRYSKATAKENTTRMMFECGMLNTNEVGYVNVMMMMISLSVVHVFRLQNSLLIIIIYMFLINFSRTTILTSRELDGIRILILLISMILSSLKNPKPTKTLSGICARPLSRNTIMIRYFCLLINHLLLVYAFFFVVVVSQVLMLIK